MEDEEELGRWVGLSWQTCQWVQHLDNLLWV